MASQQQARSKYEQTQNEILSYFYNMFDGFNQHLEKDVRDHLKNVYLTLTSALVIAIFGAVFGFFFSFLHQFGILFTIGIFILSFILHSTPSVPETETLRLSLLYVVAFLMGITVGPVVSFVAIRDPSIVFNAYVITLVVFSSFSFASLYAESTKFLCLAGILASASLVFLITSFFPRQEALHPLILWGGLMTNSLFVLYGTQFICDKRRKGDDDYVKHTLELFVYLVNIFRYTLLILKEKAGLSEEKDKCK